MIGLTAAAAVVVADAALKRVVRRGLSGSQALSLGPLGALRLVEARVWLSRGVPPPSLRWLWTGWAVSAAALMAAAFAVPSLELAAGLVIGGSLANLLEQTRRGAVSDYVCLPWWPAFNLADAALLTGAIGAGLVIGRLAAGLV